MNNCKWEQTLQSDKIKAIAKGHMTFSVDLKKPHKKIIHNGSTRYALILTRIQPHLFRSF